MDGILFTGGGDIDPLRFGEEPIRQNGQISPLRDEYELSLCKEAMKRNLPLFGVCRGMQIMNIAAGGGIYQDIEVQTGTTLKHSQQAPRPYATHSITIIPGSQLENSGGLQRLLSIPAPSGSILSGKRLSRLCPQCGRLDGSHGNAGKDFVLGVQWHPESMHTKNRKLFSATLSRRLPVTMKGGLLHDFTSSFHPAPGIHGNRCR